MRWEELGRIAWGAMVVSGFLLAIGSAHIAREIQRRPSRIARSAIRARAMMCTYLLHGVLATLSGLLGLMGYEIAAFAAVLLLIVASTRPLRRLPEALRARHRHPYPVLSPHRKRRGERGRIPGSQ